jgi:succinate dehydrogenase/fumarate reductase flavoprotein subunit
VDVDVLVIGAGVAGLSAAVTAAAEGASVLVVEKSHHVGGSGAMSAGMFWAPSDETALRARVPFGNQDVGARIIDEFRSTVDDLRASGIRVDESPRTVMTIGIAYPMDIGALLQRQVQQLRRSACTLSLGVRARSLLTTSDGSVVGAVVQESSGNVRNVAARAVVLATGGFQGSAELRARYMGPAADSIVVRSHDGNVGDGFRMGLRAGAAASQSLGTFYGHLMPSPMRAAGPEHFIRAAQFFSARCLLLNRRGERFCDETEGDEVNNQEVLRQPDARAVLICDEAVYREYGCAEPFPNGGRLDRLKEAQAVGGRVAHAATLEKLCAELASWGVDAQVAIETIRSYDSAQRRAAASGEAVLLGGVPVSPASHRIGTAPFHAAEVQPSITFTYGGLRGNTDGAVLDDDGRAIPGAFVAGTDLGGTSNWAYAGGLAMAHITGRWAGASAASFARSATEPSDPLPDTVGSPTGARTSGVG